MSKSVRGRGRPQGFIPNPPSKAPSSVKRLLYTREQTAECLGGISVSSLIRLERDGSLSKVRLRGLTGQVFHRADQVEALGAGRIEKGDAGDAAARVGPPGTSASDSAAAVAKHASAVPPMH